MFILYQQTHRTHGSRKQSTHTTVSAAHHTATLPYRPRLRAQHHIELFVCADHAPAAHPNLLWIPLSFLIVEYATNWLTRESE